MTESSNAARPMADRFAALRRFTRLVAPYVGPDESQEAALAAAGELAERGHDRLSLVDGHTVVALAGATGVGKSSLFNALAKMEISPSGHLRPTTGQAYACVWGEGAQPLLDWLGVAPHRRFHRESVLDAEDEAALRGLVLIDLPDVDSLTAGNRVEADRLVTGGPEHPGGVVDLVIWVLDPQKYADQTVHEQYLQRLGALRDVTVVVFNQTDLLTPIDAARCRDDLARLVDADGMAGVPVIATSALTGEGVGEVHALLEKVVAERDSAVMRLEAELRSAVDDVTAIAPKPGHDEDWVSGQAVPELAKGFAAATGVDAYVAEAVAGFRERTRVMRLRRSPQPSSGPAGVDAAQVRESVRRLAEDAGADLPPSWAQRLRESVVADTETISAQLSRSVPLAPMPVGPLWTVLRGGWWLAIVVALAGILDTVLGLARGQSLGAGWLWMGTAVVGVAASVGLPLGGRALTAWRARRQRRMVADRLQLDMLTVARETVAPVRQVLRDYDEAYTLLGLARQ